MKIDAAAHCTTSSCSSLIETWFGTSISQGTMNASVTSVYQTMQTKAGDSQYICPVDSTNGCSGNVFAYVYPSDPTQSIYMCQFVFSYPDYAEKVQTVIHELSHFKTIGSTNDAKYGEEACHLLAQSSPAAAMLTADNFGYFAIYSNLCYLNAGSGYTVKVPPCYCSAGSYQTTPATCTDAPTSAPTGAPTVEVQVATEISFDSALTDAQKSAAKTVYFEELNSTFSSSATFSNETIMLVQFAFETTVDDRRGARRANSYTATGHGTAPDRGAFVSQLGASKSSFKTSLGSNLQSALGVTATVSDYTSVVQSDAPTNGPTTISDSNDDDDDEGLITMERIVMLAMLVAFICIVVLLIWCCVKCCCKNDKYVPNQHPQPHQRPQRHGQQQQLQGDLVEVSLRADWNCSACTMLNSGCALSCTACGGAQPINRRQTAPPAQFTTPRGRQMAAGPTWSCAGCTTANPSSATRCASCGRVKAAVAPATRNPLPQPKPASSDWFHHNKPCHRTASNAEIAVWFRTSSTQSGANTSQWFHNKPCHRTASDSEIADWFRTISDSELFSAPVAHQHVGVVVSPAGGTPNTGNMSARLRETSSGIFDPESRSPSARPPVNRRNTTM